MLTFINKTLTSHQEVPGFEFQLCSQSSLWMHIRDTAGNGSNVWVNATHVGTGLSSQLLLSAWPSLAVAGIWGVTREGEIFVFHSTSLHLSNKLKLKQNF